MCRWCLWLQGLHTQSLTHSTRQTHLITHTTHTYTHCTHMHVCTHAHARRVCACARTASQSHIESDTHTHVPFVCAPPPQALLSECAGADLYGADLARQHDMLMDAASQGLNNYGAILRKLLPPDYPGYSYHQKWYEVSAGTTWLDYHLLCLRPPCVTR